MTRVVVHIDRMVLNGFRNADSHTIVEGMRGELARLLARPERDRPSQCALQLSLISRAI